MNKRDWQADKKEWDEFHNGWFPGGASNKREAFVGFAYFAMDALPYWLQQYNSAIEGYRLLRKLHDEQCSRTMEYYNDMVKEKERADQAEAREQKLKEALERILKITKEEAASNYYTNTITLRQKIIENLFSTLYPKEESR